MNADPATVEAQLAALYPYLPAAAVSSAVAQAEAARASAASLNEVLAGTTPAYLRPPVVPNVAPGLTEVDLRFEIRDPRTGRTRQVFVRADIAGPVTAATLQAQADAWVAWYARQYATAAVPVPLNLSVVAAVQGPAVGV